MVNTLKVVLGSSRVFFARKQRRHRRASVPVQSYQHLKGSLTGKLIQRGSFMVWEINMGVCPRLEFDNIMIIICLGYDFYIYGAFEFFMQFQC